MVARMIGFRTGASRRRNLLQAAAGAAICLLASGCGKGKSAGGFAPPPTPVETATVTSGAVADRFATVGTLEAGESVDIAAEIDGIVKALPFPEGGQVAAGSLIARLDDAQLAAETKRAEALTEQSRATFERVRAVVDQGAGAPQDLDDATAALKVAEANLDLARTRLAKTRVTAPFAGTAGIRRVSPGAFVRAGATLTDLTQLDRLVMYLSGPAADYATQTSTDARTATTVGDGSYRITFPNAIPAEATGTYRISMVSRKRLQLMAGTEKQRQADDIATNAQMSFSVDGSPVAARRQVVDTAKCNACHIRLTFHGTQNTVDQCVIKRLNTGGERPHQVHELAQALLELGDPPIQRRRAGHDRRAARTASMSARSMAAWLPLNQVGNCTTAAGRR